jgi:hypothetical protein
MKRRHFLATIAAGSITPGSAQDAPVSSALVRTPLVIMAPRSDGFDAVWAVSRLSRGWVEWEGADGAKGIARCDAHGLVPQGDDVLRVRIDGLGAGMSYKVRSHTVAFSDGETIVSDWKTLRTLAPLSPTARFVMWNDTHIHNETIRALDEATPSADFLLWNGDLCNDWTKPELLVPTILSPAGRDVTANRPLFIAWGNHDVRGAHAYQMSSMVATPNGRPFYAFRAGPVAAICLHTCEDKPDDHPSFKERVAFDALRAEQAAWLAKIIRTPEFGDAPYRVVFCHIPLRWTTETPKDYANGGYDSFSGRSRDAWHQSLVDWKAQIVLSGHMHKDAWIPPTSEFPYGQLVGGGPKPLQATWTEANADGSALVFKMRNLAGEILHEVAFQPLA